MLASDIRDHGLRREGGEEKFRPCRRPRSDRP